MAAATNKRRPLIGCTTYRKISGRDQPIEIIGLTSTYVEAVAAAGGIPILIPLGLGEEALMAIFDRIDGLLLPGGADIEPTIYRKNGNGLSRGIDIDRDRVELLLARTAVTQEKPFFAICRGIQVLNVALGGNLYEDIQAEFSDAIQHDFNDIRPRNYLAHEVAIHSDSILFNQLRKTTTAVNSLHHQNVRDLAPELVATAVAPDGLVEGVEVPGHPFALAVQWHPEMLIHDDPGMLALFKAFVQASGNQ